MAQRPAAEGDKGLELSVGVVDAGHHGVLVGGTTARCLGIGGHRVTQALEVILAHAGHQLVAGVLHGGVQGDGECELFGLGGKATNLRKDAGGGHRDVTGADVEAVLAVEDAHGLKHGVVVEEGLALTHEDDAADARAKVVGNDAHLVDDLAGAEVAGVAVAARGAEGAAHGAAGLRGHAHAELVLAGHADGLNEGAVAHADEVLARAVLGNLLLGDGYRKKGELLGKPLAQVLGKVGHLLIGGDALAVEPLNDLLGPKRRGVHLLLENLGDLVAAESLDADTFNGCAFHVVIPPLLLEKPIPS